jgi:pyruvyltransferase
MILIENKLCLASIFFYIFLLLPIGGYAEDAMFWWKSSVGKNFGDELSPVIIERILGRKIRHKSHKSSEKNLMALGSVLHFAKNGDVIWGSGFREDPSLENRFQNLDVRAVRGPRTREFLLNMGIDCPEIYGDPAILMGQLFPEYKQEKIIYDYIIIPNIGEIGCFMLYKNVVLPTEPWNQVVQKITQSRLVISSSLHGLIVAESFRIPARLLKMTWGESLLKYQDYYESSGRPTFQYATSVQKALQMGGEEPSYIDSKALIASFPWDYFTES